MRNFKLFSIALAFAVLTLTGCRDDHYHDDYGRNSYTTQIVSDPAYDGDIEQTSSSTYTVTQGMSSGVQSVFVGIDPNTSTEFRTFLNFPLAGN